MDEEVFAAILDAAPAAISFHMGVPADLIAKAHDSGSCWIQQVGDLRTAELALEAGADVLVAQGWEAGGNAGWVATMVLVPQVVDAAGDVPVLAAGGIADGRGIAAALALGAQGVVLGTRFLASDEMSVDASWKQRIVAADAVDAVKVANGERVLPPFAPRASPWAAACAPSAAHAAHRSVGDWNPESVDPATVVPAFVAEARANGGHDMLPFTGQSAALVHDVAPAADIVARLVAQAEARSRRRGLLGPIATRRPVHALRRGLSALLASSHGSSLGWTAVGTSRSSGSRTPQLMRCWKPFPRKSAARHFGLVLPDGRMLPAGAAALGVLERWRRGRSAR